MNSTDIVKAITTKKDLLLAKTKDIHDQLTKQEGAKLIVEPINIPVDLHGCLRKCLYSAAAAGPVGAFSSVADISSIATIWGVILVKFAMHYGIHISKEDAVKICSSALLGMGGYYVGCKAATRLFNLIPGAGTLTAMGASSVQNILFTYRFALTAATMFSSYQPNMEYASMARTIVSMFHGNGFKSDCKQIVMLMVVSKDKIKA